VHITPFKNQISKIKYQNDNAKSKNFKPFLILAVILIFAF